MTMLMPVRLLDGPSGGTIAYDFWQLQQMTDDIDQVIRAMRTTLDELNVSLRGKLALWDGGAFGNYSATQTAWNGAADEIAVLLDTIKRAVVDANQRMFETEALNQRLLSRGVQLGV